MRLTWSCILRPQLEKGLTLQRLQLQISTSLYLTSPHLHISISPSLHIYSLPHLHISTCTHLNIYMVSKKTMPLYIGIHFCITTSTGMHLTYTNWENNILQGSATETTPTPTLLPWLPWKTNMLIFTILS